jgi:hypothetical protein
MSTRTGKPVEDSAPADELAAWVAAAEGLRASVPPVHASNLDYSWHSLRALDRVLDDVSRSRVPFGIRTRLGLAAYVGEVLVREFGGSWATGECYGEVMAPPGATPEPDGCAQSARPTEMVERRIRQHDSLQHQVFEQVRAWGVEPSGDARADGDSPATAMRRAADVFVRTAASKGVTWLDYSADSVARLDALIPQWWPDGPPADAVETTAPSMGAYVGQVLAMDSGARWVRDERQGFGLVHGDQVVFPATEVSRRLQLGPASAIGEFFDEVSLRWHLSGEAKTTSRDRAGSGRRGGLFGRGGG